MSNGATASGQHTNWEQWREARRIDSINAFHRLYAEWLRAVATRTEPTPDDDDLVAAQCGEREDELARQLIAHPGHHPWMTVRKIHVMQHYLADAGGGYADNREVAMLGAILADVLRFRSPEYS